MCSLPACWFWAGHSSRGQLASCITVIVLCCVMLRLCGFVWPWPRLLPPLANTQKACTLWHTHLLNCTQPNTSNNRYKWLATKTGGQFGRIYSLQQQGKAFDTPQAWLEAVGLFNATQQSAAGYMAVRNAAGWLAGCLCLELAAGCWCCWACSCEQHCCFCGRCWQLRRNAVGMAPHSRVGAPYGIMP